MTAGKMEKIAADILTFKTLKEVAKENGISERTLRRLRSSPEFQEIQAKVRAAAYDRAFDAVCASAAESATALREIMKNPKAPASARVSASRALLELAYKHNEDMDRARIAALEEFVERFNREDWSQ